MDEKGIPCFSWAGGLAVHGHGLRVTSWADPYGLQLVVLTACHAPLLLWLSPSLDVHHPQWLVPHPLDHQDVG